MREPCSWTNAVPTNVTVMGVPVHGFTSANTSRIGNSAGGSAAAGAANARATTLSRARTSLIAVSLLNWATLRREIVSNRVSSYKAAAAGSDRHPTNYSKRSSAPLAPRGAKTGRGDSFEDPRPPLSLPLTRITAVRLSDLLTGSRKSSGRICSRVARSRSPPTSRSTGDSASVKRGRVETRSATTSCRRSARNFDPTRCRHA